MLTALGIVLCVFAVAGGWPEKFPILPPDRLPLEIGGVILVVIGILLYVWEAWQKRRGDRELVSVVPDAAPDAALFKAQIDYPAQNALVDEVVDAGGTVPKAPLLGMNGACCAGIRNEGDLFPTDTSILTRSRGNGASSAFKLQVNLVGSPTIKGAWRFGLWGRTAGRS